MLSDADWCCLPTDENGLWFNRRFSEETFFRNWELMVQRHLNFSNVIGAELRNELRGSCGSDDADGNPVCRYAREKLAQRPSIETWGWARENGRGWVRGRENGRGCRRS